MNKAEILRPGRVVAGYGRHYIVEEPDGTRLLCHPRGKKSDCVVGDQVRWKPTGESSGEGVIEKVEPRRNLLFRQDEWRTKSFAANIDGIVVLVASEPAFSESQLARALIAAASAGIEVRILLNKADLPAIEGARQRLAPYTAMGYEVIEVTLKAEPEAAHARMAPLFARRSTLVLGPSGAGKSTLINLMVPSASAQVGEISQALQSGKHTTTTTQWYWMDAERQTGLIDSPGFQEFGIRQIDAHDLAGLMPDLREPATHCRFYNCTHLHEPGCGVIAALERGEVNPSRYRIYGELFGELSRKSY